MKAALISFHNAYNYGACLQAYALQEAVTKMGIECEYIDYLNERRAGGYKMSVRIRNSLKKKDVKGLLKNICGAPFVWSRGRKFNKFYAEYLKKTAQTYHSCQEAEQLDGLYDRYVVGSDQVWNDAHNGADPAFFLDFVKDNKKKISYASSFGMADIPQEARERYARLLNNIEHLSTREQKGVDIIHDLTGREAKLVLDPVFLPDTSDWKRLIDTQKSPSQYTFYYINTKFNPERFRTVTEWKDKKRHILSASVKPKDFVQRHQKVTFAMSPQGFLQEINDAELVVTTSFHCLAFAIIFHKKFVAILSGDQGRDERLLNLLEITGLQDRIFSDKMTVKDIRREIDYEKVDRRLAEYKRFSLDFLRDALYSETQERTDG